MVPGGASFVADGQLKLRSRADIYPPRRWAVTTCAPSVEAGGLTSAAPSSAAGLPLAKPAQHKHKP